MRNNYDEYINPYEPDLGGTDSVTDVHDVEVFDPENDDTTFGTEDPDGFGSDGPDMD